MPASIEALLKKLDRSCKRALEIALADCMARGHAELLPEHFLYSLISFSGTSDLHTLIPSLGGDLAVCEEQLSGYLDAIAPAGIRRPGLSSRLLALLADSWAVASLDYGATEIRSAHVLLTMMEGGQAPAALQPLAAKLRARFPEGGEDPGPDGPVAAEEAPVSVGAAPSGALARFTSDLTEQARKGRLDPVIGRHQKIAEIADILARRRQNNAVLTGDAGVGKTALVEGLAQRIVAGEVPQALLGVSILSLDIAAMMAGTSIRGEFEERLQSVVRELKARSAQVILFIDEAHTLFGATSPGMPDAASLLKPALARGEFRTIAATTWAEYKRSFERDAALARRFEVVQVEEPPAAEAVAILRALREKLEEHHGVRIAADAMEAAVHLSVRYVTGRRLPDKAVNLLDSTCARVALSLNSPPAEILQLQGRLLLLEEEIRSIRREQLEGLPEEARGAVVYDQMAETETRLADLEDRYAQEKALVNQIVALRRVDAPATDELARLRDELAAVQGDTPLIYPEVNARAVAAVVSVWTGIPTGQIAGSEVQAVLSLKPRLAERIAGQSHAIETIASHIQSAWARLENPDKPVGVFLLTGPSGTGKTETAVALADILYAGARSLITINLSEYQEAHSISGLKGAPPGYVGYGESGVLAEAVYRRPYSVVLLDEAEKAHPDVLELFYDVLDRGRMEDATGRRIDFRHTVIILTANVGAERIASMCARTPGVAPSPDDLISAIMPELSKVFRPALLGRMSVIPYLPIFDGTLRHIAEMKLEALRRRVREHHGVELTYSDELVEHLAERSRNAENGARRIDQLMSASVIPELARRFISPGWHPEGGIHLDLSTSGSVRVSTGP